jgi:hypothetical protein
VQYIFNWYPCSYDGGPCSRKPNRIILHHNDNCLHEIPKPEIHQNKIIFIWYLSIMIFRKEMSFIWEKWKVVQVDIRRGMVYSHNCSHNCWEEFCRRMAITASFGNLSEYENLKLSWAHGITSVTGLRLGAYLISKLSCHAQLMTLCNMSEILDGDEPSVLKILQIHHMPSLSLCDHLVIFL